VIHWVAFVGVGSGGVIGSTGRALRWSSRNGGLDRFSQAATLRRKYPSGESNQIAALFVASAIRYAGKDFLKGRPLFLSARISSKTNLSSNVSQRLPTNASTR
jgi:hypothetical protein